MSDDFINSSFWHSCVFRGISDNPNPALKRLTISLLALKGKDLLVPCIRRQIFTRSLHYKAKVYQDPKSSQANFLPFGVGKPELSCSDLVQTYVDRNTPRRKPLQV